MIDFDALLSVPAMAAFAEPVMVRRAGGSTFTVRGVFDRRHFTADMGDGPAQTLQRVTLAIRLAELPPGIILRAGDRVQRGGVEYIIVAPPEVDAMGGALLILGAVQP
jgi:hypothetical protein